MDLLYTVVITLATLAILVAVHEYGHFAVARACGVKVLRFSIGFGRGLFRWHDKQGTEYVVAAIPLGGYVKMLDEREEEVPAAEQHMAFNRKSPLQRIAVVVAGPAANFLLAICAYWFLFVSGESGYAPIIGSVERGSLADVAGLEAGQEIVAIDGHETPTWKAVNYRLFDRVGETGEIRLSVIYPDSDVEYESAAAITAWLSNEEIPNVLDGLGLAVYRPATKPIIFQVVEDSPASRSGMEPGDVIRSADGVVIHNWDDWVDYVTPRFGRSISLEYERDGLIRFSEITPERAVIESGEVIGRVGMTAVSSPMPPEMIRNFKRGPFEALLKAVDSTGQMSVSILNAIKKLILGDISPKSLSGPITIAKVATQSAKSGLESWVEILAYLSISLGVLNLLPIPVLDGGHLLFYSLEWLVGRPVPERVQLIGYQLGLMVVLGVMGFAFYNDIARL